HVDQIDLQIEHQNRHVAVAQVVAVAQGTEPVISPRIDVAILDRQAVAAPGRDGGYTAEFADTGRVFYRDGNGTVDALLAFPIAEVAIPVVAPRKDLAILDHQAVQASRRDGGHATEMVDAR